MRKEKTMRQLVIDRLIELANDDLDLTDLDINPTTVEDLPTLTDEQLLAVYTEAVGFSG